MPTDIWGNATWLLFHTLAAQIDENQFVKNRNLLVEIITTTCAHLPCPTCTKDATNIIKRANLHNIKTKKDFIEFLRQFHNIVNIKLNKKSYSEEEIKTKYNKVNLVNVIQNFVNIFSNPSGNMRMITHSFQQQNFIKQLIPKLQKLAQCCIGR